MPANGPTTPPPPKFRDFLGSYEMGINSGDHPLIVPPNQLSFASNLSVRGNYAKPRPAFVNRTINGFPAASAGALWQGAGYYKPDSGTEQLIAQIGGRLFTFTPQADNSMTAVDVSIPGDLNSATAPQAWLWQAEKWMIIQNGVANVNPIFYDGTISRRSVTTTTTNFQTTTAGTGIVPAIGSSITIAFTSVANLVIGDIVTEGNAGQWVVNNIVGANVTLVNQNIPYIGYSIPNGAKMYWTHVGGNELPPGRMGAYVQGRVWLSLVDGKQFIAGDLVGGSSGTQALNFRDAVLKVTENTYLLGGGNFTVPGSVGDIKAMTPQVVLDQQFGQGPLLVVTPRITFSCKSPVDRSTWASLTNPIISETMRANGGLSQNSTINMNSDVVMRALDGLRSLIMAMRDFETWGDTPFSFEVTRAIQNDAKDLLVYSSAIFFDNRLLMTAAPVSSPNHGVYFQSIISLNTDPLSSISGKEASLWEGPWLGLNVLQLVSGDFNGVERAFAFVFNTTTNQIEIHEILEEDAANFDDVHTPITLIMESGAKFKDADPRKREFKKLWNGDISVDDVVGNVEFEVSYRPDQYPGWIPWRNWTICASEQTADPNTVDFQPGYFPRMGLGQPSITAVGCDGCNNRVFPTGYTFQIRIRITGHCRFLGGRLEAVHEPEPEFAKIQCDLPCAT